MSTAQFAVLGRGRIEPPSRELEAGEASRGASLTAFMLLALYGVLRWSTMLANSSGGRMFGLIVIALAIGWLGGELGATRLWARVAAAAGILVAALALFPVAGFPLRWVLALHTGRLADAIGRGVSSLPHVIVPYSGRHNATAAVIILGAGMLLLAGALALCTTRRRIGQARLVAAAVPLVVLAIVPTLLAEPKLASLHGVILFLLLMMLVFSERVRTRRVTGALGFALLAAVAALVLAPALETSRPWIDVKSIGSSALHGERFNWSQTYGPLNWPKQGQEVLGVQASFPSYWKAEDLDLFNGQGWVSENVNEGAPTAGIKQSSLARWTEPIAVTLRGMATHEVIAAGTANPPSVSAGTLIVPGSAPGTWQSERQLGPGTSYRVDVYTPSPSRQQLSAAPARYPLGALAPELQLLIPPTRRSGDLTGAPATPVGFAPFGSRQPLEAYGGLNRFQEAMLIRTSVYAPAFRLARQLRAQAATPYTYVRAVLRYFTHGFHYDQNPPRSQYPLVSFLFGNRRGYCQQFAGAMALLLRMGGIPARVAAGFTTGTYDPRNRTYIVSDLDAHTWVEAWFAGYGWVTFDPTPAVDPALSGHTPLPAGQSASSLQPRGSASAPGRVRHSGAAAPTGPRHRTTHSSRSSGGAPAGPIILGILAALLLGLSVLWWRRPRTPEALVEEFQRAFARCGRPLAPGMTLAALERRFADTPAAAEYVGALRRARYAGERGLPSREQRRAVRRRLRRGLGPIGWVRALVALPPLARRLGPR
jgi:hypothetical protein